MKYILYDTIEEWNASNDAMNELFGLPKLHTETYASVAQVDNLSHSAFGKYIFPVLTEGKYDASAHFTDNLVDVDPEWMKEEELV